MAQRCKQKCKQIKKKLFNGEIVIKITFVLAFGPDLDSRMDIWIEQNMCPSVSKPHVIDLEILNKFIIFKW